MDESIFFLVSITVAIVCVYAMHENGHNQIEHTLHANGIDATMPLCAVGYSTKIDSIKRQPRHFHYIHVCCVFGAQLTGLNG